MAYVARPSDFHGATPYQAATLTSAVTPERPSRRRLWLRTLDRLFDTQRRDTEQDVAQYVARRGKLTDSMEREIADRFITGS